MSYMDMNKILPQSSEDTSDAILKEYINDDKFGGDRSGHHEDRSGQPEGVKAASFFEPYQFGVACPRGAERIIHGLRACVEEHWLEEDFGVLKVDMKMLSTRFPAELFSLSVLNISQSSYFGIWCPARRSPWSLLFSLVLNVLVKTISEDKACSSNLFHAWYLDDDVLAGPRQSLCRCLSLLQVHGPALGLLVNVSKCEVFSHHNLDVFPSGMKASDKPNIVILGVAIGDLDFCSSFISTKRMEARALLLQLEQVGVLDPQVALVLLRLCGGFCKLVHLARSTPPSLSSQALSLFDNDIRRVFSECTGVDTSDTAWKQAQLSLSRGGLGLRSLSHHSSAAYISSICSSGFGCKSVHHLSQAVEVFNNLVFPVEAINVESVLSPPIQKTLSSKFDDHLFNNLITISSLADKARLLFISSPHASAWLSVTPSEGLGLHLDPPVFQIAVKWWLGLDTSEGSQCILCPGVLDHLGHHAVTCKYGGDVVSRHNKIRDILVETCRRAHIGVQMEVGNNLTHDHNKTRPANILLSNWFLGKPAALDVSITSPLNPLTLLEAGVLAKSAAQVTEARKHQANDPKCSELGWVCVPMVAESYGAWGDEASSIISSIASRLATSTCKSKSVVLNDIYGRLNVHLVCANATAILSRIIPLS
ncbi:hypothetical protein EMCRGX_G031522 [Ephydatia muelleri]